MESELVRWNNQRKLTEILNFFEISLVFPATSNERRSRSKWGNSKVNVWVSFRREDKKNGSVCCGCGAGAKRTEEDPPVASLVHTHTPGHPLAVARSCAEG